MNRLYRNDVFLLAAFLSAAASSTGWAVPYASAVRNTTGSTYEFVLNEAADSVTINFDVGAPMVINNPVAGRHTFDLSGASTFEIDVAKNVSTGWTLLSDTADLFTHFERPYGMTVNNNPASPFFGTVYVNNSNNAPTATGRTMGDGIYALTADLMGVDLGNDFAAVSDPNDTTQAKAPGWTVSASTNSAFHISLDAAGNIIASDWSDASGGIKYATADLTSGGLLLEFEDGNRPLLLNGSGQEVHGSITSTPYTTGSVGDNLVVYALDEDYDLDGDTLIASSGNHLWKWNVGNGTDYDQPPELVINVDPLATANSDGTAAFLNLNIGVLADAIYSPVHDKWYLTEGRNDGNESSIAIVTADGVDGNSPALEWSSKQFSIDNGLDGFADVVDAYAGSAGIQDIFRESGSLTISPDGTKLYVHRAFVYGENVIVNPEAAPEDQQPNNNPYLGQESNQPGLVLVIPLDENGIPDIQIDDNGTPEDTTDDVIMNIESINLGGNSAHSRVPISLDAAGNVYITNHVDELLYVFSPGGNTLATTTSAGTFEVMIVTGGEVVGDYNNDGVVGAADYTVWRDNLGTDISLPNDPAGGVIGDEQYTQWRANYGATVGSGSASVPEPAGFWLLLLAVSFRFTRRSGTRLFND